MCEKRTRKVRKGSKLLRLRENRRMQRMHLLVPSTAVETVPCPFQPIDKEAQCRLILELALKTISLMQNNSLIQKKIVALQKETSEFVASVMSNPENKRRYLEHVREFGPIQKAQTHPQMHPPSQLITNLSLKLESL